MNYNNQESLESLNEQELVVPENEPAEKLYPDANADEPLDNLFPEDKPLNELYPDFIEDESIEDLSQDLPDDVSNEKVPANTPKVGSVENSQAASSESLPPSPSSSSSPSPPPNTPQQSSSSVATSVSTFVENNEHGGSWVDSFDDNSGIDLANSGIFTIASEKIRIDHFNSTILVSKPINISANCEWDSIIINKTQPLNTYLNITILDASTGLQIPSSLTYSSEGEFDISYIDLAMYPSLKLKAEFNPSSTERPILHYWGVSWNDTNAWRDSLFGGLKCSSQSLIEGDGEIWLNTTPTEWYKYSGNPILTTGTGSSWDNNVVNSAAVVFNGTDYLMYYSAMGSKFQIGLATSPDGITWTKHSGNPIITTGAVGSWEEVHVRNCYISYDGNLYRMWYRGHESSKYDWNGGYATSTDGINWVKHTGNPIFQTGSSSLDWDYHYAYINDIYFDGVTYRAWYTGHNQFSTSKAPYQIGYTTSIDGLNWNKYSGNPIISGPQGWYNGVAKMSVVHEYGNYLGWYIYKTAVGQPLEIHFAHSNDGINWVKFGNNPVLQKGPSGAWDSNTVGDPHVVYRDKQYHMYYVGSNGIKTQIGLAKSKFDPVGILNSSPITVPANYKWDTLILNKTEPTNTAITFTIIDNSTNLPIPGYIKLTNSTLNLTGLDSKTYPSVKLQAEFTTSDRKNTPILYDWSINWSFSNLAPVAEAGLNQTVFENQQVKFNGTGSYDPDGSIVNWSWDIDADGGFDLYGPYVNFTYNDDSINNVTLMVTDDQGANDTDWVVITVLNFNSTIDNVTVSNAYPRTIGYWKHQCNLNTTPNSDHTGIPPEFIASVNANSSVFYDLSSKYDILDILEPDDHSNMTLKTKQQLLALWLNVVSGKLGINTPLNLTNLTYASTVGTAITEIEQIILNSSTNRTEMERAKNIADSINNGLGINSGTTLYLNLSDRGSDDIYLIIVWGDGSANTTMSFYNNAPLNIMDPYPSQFFGFAPYFVYTEQSQNYSSTGTYMITITVQDDDGGIDTKIIYISI